MNFITFNMLILMVKMSLEQVQIMGVEISILMLSIMTHLVALDEIIELWSNTLSTLIGVIIVVMVTMFQTFTNSQPKTPLNFKNITF